MPSRRAAGVAPPGRGGGLDVAVLYLALLPALVLLPTLGGHDPAVVSAAAAAGYSNRIAHLVAVAWMALAVAWVALATRGAADGVPGPALAAPPAPRLVAPLLLGLTVLGAVALYFPPALALRGPFMEESIHLTALHRMLTGDVPYRDFEFLYGPLMLYPAYWWVTVAGYSLTAFYAFVAALEALVLVLVLVPVLAHLRGTWARIGAMALLGSLVVNGMLGPNQSGLRKIGGVLILLNAAHRPLAPGAWAANGVATGLLLAWSQEFGGATAIGLAAIHLSILAKRREARALLGLAVTAAVAAATWLGTVWLLLGDAVPDYIASVRYLTAAFDAGEAAFPYYWTLSGLAVFALIALAAWAAGRSLARRWEVAPGPSELLVLGALGYAAVMLKSGLSRADQWHLVPDVLVIVVALVLPLRATVFALPRGARRLGLALSVVLALCYTYGQYRILHYVFREGLIEGYRELARGPAPASAPAVEPVWPATIDQRADPSPALADLAEFLATPPARGRRVFLYEGLWALAYRLGVAKGGYLADDYLYGDARGEAAREWLDAHPDALVVMDVPTWEWLRLGPDAPAPEPALNLLGVGRARALRAWLSSVHVPAVAVEERQKAERWRRLVGLPILDAYAPVHRNERFVVLGRAAP